MAKKRPTRARARRSSPVLSGSGLILREKEPLNLESPQSALRTWITSSDQFYVRNHFPEPELKRSTWRLRVEGAVKKPRNFSYRDLTTMASHSQVSVIECAGNGRVFLTPKEDGAQWQSGAAGNAEFTGVPLTALLERVGILSTAVDVIFEGADHGEIEDEPYITRRHPFCAQRARRDRTRRRRVAGLQDERRRPDQVTRIPRACRCPGLVWNGVSEVAQTHRGD